jgi:deazaflavin-dependent oxidoreductase (nitroreductase family)
MGSGSSCSGGGRRSDWVRNLTADPRVGVKIGERSFSGHAAIITDPNDDQMARRLLATKYQGWQEGQEMSGWAQTALPVAIDLEPASI